MDCVDVERDRDSLGQVKCGVVVGLSVVLLLYEIGYKLPLLLLLLLLPLLAVYRILVRGEQEREHKQLRNIKKVCCRKMNFVGLWGSGPTEGGWYRIHDYV